VGAHAPLASYSAFKWAGDTLHLAGLVAYDNSLGRVVRGYEDLPAEVAAELATGAPSIDLKEGPIAAQAWFVLNEAKLILEAQGLGLGDVVRLHQYMTDLRDFPVYNRVRLMFFPADPPASTVLQVSGLLPSEDSRLEVDVIAHRPGSGGSR
jgi:enamine deaminase RidA (YjgF/YER057c/UK114 family)